MFIDSIIYRRDFRVIVARTPNTTDVKPQVTVYRDIGVSRVVRKVVRSYTQRLTVLLYIAVYMQMQT